MNNFDICYNALCNAFHKENVIMPSALVNILKLDDVVHSNITLTNTSNIGSDSDTTTNNDKYSSDDSNKIDSNKSIQENVNQGRNDDGVAYVSLLCQFFL
jgi:hypothetical protein